MDINRPNTGYFGTAIGMIPEQVTDHRFNIHNDGIESQKGTLLQPIKWHYLPMQHQTKAIFSL